MNVQVPQLPAKAMPPIRMSATAVASPRVATKKPPPTWLPPGLIMGPAIPKLTAPAQPKALAPNLPPAKARPLHRADDLPQPDLRGGGPETSNNGGSPSEDASWMQQVGSKKWLDMVAAGLKARHLEPPMSQIKLIAADPKSAERLKACDKTARVLDIVCGSARKAGLGWVRAGGDKTTSKNDKDPNPPKQTIQVPIDKYRLRLTDWQAVRPDKLICPLEFTHGAFAANSDHSNNDGLWTRKAGAYLIDTAIAERMLKATPANLPPALTFAIFTEGKTSRSSDDAIDVVAVDPSGDLEIKKLWITNLGVNKLHHVTMQAKTLAKVDQVEIQCEIWPDMLEPDDDEKRFLDEIILKQKAKAADKGKGSDKQKGKGKGKHKGALQLEAQQTANINEALGKLLAQPQQIHSWRPTNHRVFENRIWCLLRMDRAKALQWLTIGTNCPAIQFKPTTHLEELDKHWRMVWANAKLMDEFQDTHPLQVHKELSFRIAALQGKVSIVRVQDGWACRCPSELEPDVREALQPGSIHVPRYHIRFSIDRIPAEIDPEAILATLQVDDFKPYKVAVKHYLEGGKRMQRIVLAASTMPKDLACAIAYSSGHRQNVLPVLLKVDKCAEGCADETVRETEPKLRRTSSASPVPVRQPEANMPAAPPNLNGGSMDNCNHDMIKCKAKLAITAGVQLAAILLHCLGFKDIMTLGHMSLLICGLLTTWAIHDLTPDIPPLRDRMREVELKNASARRRDMRELHCANRELLGDTWKSTPMTCKATLRFIQQGTVLTAARMHRDSRGRVSAVCPFCDSHEEDEIHRYWSCVTWNNTRQQCLGSNTDSITQAMSLAPAATSMCAIPTNNMSPVLVEHWQPLPTV